MKVILQTDVKKLGKKGELVEVAEGYARNYLVPRGMAQVANEANLKSLHTEKSRAKAREKREEEDARHLAGQLSALTVTIAAKTGDSGRLFGSVTAGDIADAVQKAAGLTVDKRKIDLDDPIKALGTYQVPVRVQSGITSTVNVSVIEVQGEEG